MERTPTKDKRRYKEKTDRNRSIAQKNHQFDISAMIIYLLQYIKLGSVSVKRTWTARKSVATHKIFSEINKF
jgi:hypothetical protein